MLWGQRDCKLAISGLYLYFAWPTQDFLNSESIYAIMRFNLEKRILGVVGGFFREMENSSNIGLIFFYGKIG